MLCMCTHRTRRAHAPGEPLVAAALLQGRYGRAVGSHGGPGALPAVQQEVRWCWLDFTWLQVLGCWGIVCLLQVHPVNQVTRLQSRRTCGSPAGEHWMFRFCFPAEPLTISCDALAMGCPASMTLLQPHLSWSHTSLLQGSGCLCLYLPLPGHVTPLASIRSPYAVWHNSGPSTQSPRLCQTCKPCCLISQRCMARSLRLAGVKLSDRKLPPALPSPVFPSAYHRPSLHLQAQVWRLPGSACSSPSDKSPGALHPSASAHTCAAPSLGSASACHRLSWPQLASARTSRSTLVPISAQYRLPDASLPSRNLQGVVRQAND